MEDILDKMLATKNYKEGLKEINILKHIIEAWTAEHTHIHIKHFELNITEFLKIINIKYIDILLTEIPNYQTKNIYNDNNGNIFDKLDIRYKLAIIGCTETLIKVLKCKKYNSNNEFTDIHIDQAQNILTSEYSDHIAITISNLDITESGSNKETQNNLDLETEYDAINNNYFSSVSSYVFHTFNTYTCCQIIHQNIYNMMQILICSDE